MQSINSRIEGDGSNPQTAKIKFNFQSSAYLPVEWPKVWRIFGPMPRGTKLLKGENLKEIPDKLEVAGRVYEPAKQETLKGGIDFTWLYGGYGLEPLKADEKPTTFPRADCKRNIDEEGRIA